jgi:uncharacterized protein
MDKVKMLPSGKPKIIFSRQSCIITTGQCDACPSMLGAAWESAAVNKNLYCSLAPISSSVKLDKYHEVALLNGDVSPVVLNQSAIDLLELFRVPQYENAINSFAGRHGIGAFTKRMLASGLFLPQPCAGQTLREEYHALDAWIHLTDRCNLRCDYCYVPQTTQEMSIGTGKAVIESTVQTALIHGFKKVKLKYAGGEPLLRFPLLAELHDFARNLAEEHGLDLDGVVLSNGTLFDSEIASSMQSLGLRLMISVDGLGEHHDSHRPFADRRPSSVCVMNAVRFSLDAGFKPDISITVSSRNVHGLPEVLAWALEMNLHFSINFYRENDQSITHKGLALNDDKVIASLLSAYKVIEANLPRHNFLASLTDRANLSVPHVHTCGVGQNYLVFDTQGHVSKCQMRMDAPVSSAWAADPLGDVRADLGGVRNVSVEEKEGCRDCQWKYWCAGGCPLETFRATGRYDVKSPNCNIYKALFPEALRLEGLRLLKYQDDPEVVEKIVL